jgi:hypothetical protein
MSSCPGLHCPGCGDSGGSAKVILIIGAAAVAVEVLEWIAAHALELMAITAACVALAVAAVAALFRWAARRDARHAVERPFLTAREVTAVVSAPRRELAAPALHLHFHGLPADEQAAIIRTAVAGQPGDAITEGNRS